MSAAAEPSAVSSRPLFKPDLVEGFSLLSVAVAAGYLLFVPPITGMADNGDFSRFLQIAGLEHVHTEYADRYFLYANSTYNITSPDAADSDYRSSTELIVRVARWINIGLIDGQVFDIRILGALYLALFLFALYLALVASRALKLSARILLVSFIVLMLTDAGHVAYFNSFYCEPMALTSLLLAVGCGLLFVTRQSASRLLLVGYFIAAAILVTSKPVNATLALPLGLFGLYLSGLIRPGHRYRPGIAMACALCVLAVWYQGMTPQWLRRNTNYIGIFLDLLPNSEMPERDLLTLGLDPNWIRYSGINPYSHESPLNKQSFRAEFEARVNLATTTGFYLLRPERLFSLTERCARHILITRVDHLGYYDKDSGRPPRSQPSAPWSDIRDIVFPKNLWFLAGFFLFGGAATTAGAIKGRNNRGLFLLCGALLAVAAIQFIAPTLMMGEPDLARHLYLFNVVFDLSLIVFLVSLFKLGMERLASLARGRVIRRT
jgi:hypothetical protein